MRRATVYLLPLVCLLITNNLRAQDPTILPTDDPPTTTYNNETGNNTSACYAANNPSYCLNTLPTYATTSANQGAGAETTYPDPIPEHISNISLKRLMYQHWSGQLICLYEPWFDNGGNSHKDVGYTEDSMTTVSYQDGNMLTRGCDINMVDYFGTDGTQAFNQSVTDLVYQDVDSRRVCNPTCTYPLKMGILEDEGAFYNICNPNPILSEDATKTCIETHLESDLKYISDHYANVVGTQGLYWADGSPTSMNVVGFFGACGDFAALVCGSPKYDWETIWNAVNSYVNTTNSYNFKFVFNFGDFTVPAISAGEYAWPQPYTDTTSDKDSFVDNAPSQYWWCDGFGITCNYIDNFYYQGSLHYPSQLTIGAIYSGFDDSAAGWTKGRVIAQQCGQVLLKTANEVTKGGFWGYGTGRTQIPYMILATWNDYEEGTEQESGVDNCYTAVNLQQPSGSTVNWTLSANDTKAKTNTIHHFTVWTAPTGTTNLTFGNHVAGSVTSFDLSGLGLQSGHTYDVYVELVGQPSTQNEMSAPVQYTP